MENLWEKFSSLVAETFTGDERLHEKRNENCFKVNDFSSVVERLKDQKNCVSLKRAASENNKVTAQHRAARNKELRDFVGIRLKQHSTANFFN